MHKGVLHKYIAWLIKTQRQILRFNLRSEKQNSQPLVLTSTSFQNGDLASGNLRMRLCLRAVSSHLIFHSSAGFKGIHLYHTRFCGKLVWLLGLMMCVTTAWSVRLTSEAILLSDLQANFIKMQMKYHYKNV